MGSGVIAAWLLAAGALVACSSAQAAEGGSIAELIARQAAADRAGADLAQRVRAATARGAAERANPSASRTIQDYVASREAEAARANHAGEGPLTSPIEKHLRLMEEIESDLDRADSAELAAQRSELGAYAGAQA